MILAISSNGQINGYGSEEIANENGIIITENHTIIGQSDNGILTFSIHAEGEMPVGASVFDETKLGQVPDGSGGWIDKPTPEVTEILVTPRHFTMNLLGLEVYGGLITMQDGLKAKFGAGLASTEEVQYLTILNAARDMLAQGDIDILDPSVEMILNIALANTFITFTQEDKDRVLSNTPIA